MKKIILFFFLSVFVGSIKAQVPNGFYNFEYVYSTDGINVVETGRENSFPKMLISAANMNFGFGLGKYLIINYPNIMGNIGSPHTDFNYAGVTNDGSMWIYIQNNPMGQCTCLVALDLSMAVIHQPFIDEYKHIYKIANK